MEHKFNYEEEMQKIEQNQERGTWKPEVGMFSVTVLTEPEKTIFTDEETGDNKQQIKFRIRVEDKEYDWYVNVGMTEKSLYGKLMVVGTYLGGLKGALLSLVVSSSTDKSGKIKRSYELLNYIDIKRMKKNDAAARQSENIGVN